MSVVSFVDPSYVKAQLDKLSNLNTSLTDLRDSLRGADGRTLTDIYNKLGSIGGSVGINNFPSWFTSSTKLTDDMYGKLDALSKALASVAGDKLRVGVIDALPAGDNWVGRIKIGDGTNLAAVVGSELGGTSYNMLAVAADLTKMFAAGTAYTEQSVNVGTSEASSSFSPPLKMVMLHNQGDVDINIKLNGGNTVKTLPSRTCKAIVNWKISSIAYSVASGSSTLRIEGYW